MNMTELLIFLISNGLSFKINLMTRTE